MLELNKIYNMNCLDGLKLMDDECVDLTVTSPPYDNLRTYKGYSFDFENIAKELYRVTKKGGIVVWIVGDATIKGSETGTSFKQALYFKEIGFNLHDTMIYLKNICPFPDINRYYQGFEYMFILTKGKIKTFNLIDDRENKSSGRKVSGTQREKSGITTKKIKNGNIIKEKGIRFNYWLVSNGKRQSEHPATFPEQLVSDHIISWSNENDIVLDIFMGSGTTAKMAMFQNRNYIGFDISKEYCELAERRIENNINLFTDTL